MALPCGPLRPTCTPIPVKPGATVTDSSATPRDFANRLNHSPWFAPWCMVAAFGAYACMYGFRKPFTAGSYTGGAWGANFKAWLVITQVLGYTLSKFIGIRVIAELPPHRRAMCLVLLIALAELALLLFAITPAPHAAVWLFANGLPLGMVFGVVLGFLEGRRMTEAFVAGLCASFILADGFTKSVGATLLKSGVPERWMPATAGFIFLVPLPVFVWMLLQILPPSSEDRAARSERAAMSKADRMGLLRRHGMGLALITSGYLLITVLRGVRADFAPEIWGGLGVGAQPAVFTSSELWVALGVLLLNGCLCLVRDNRRAFQWSLRICVGGVTLALLALASLGRAYLPPFAFMALFGLGIYLPYVTVHTTVFERLIAVTRERANLGYLMYLADAAGYFGYVAVLLAKIFWCPKAAFLPFFSTLSWIALALAALSFMGAAAFFSRHLRKVE
ncbi:MAG TPA: DUF5690 family protein [Verrucomicrobiae bacterium]|nr:DUF5690 family protein [Verrucomicrobiae bacterium]